MAKQSFIGKVELLLSHSVVKIKLYYHFLKVRIILQKDYIRVFVIIITVVAWLAVTIISICMVCILPLSLFSGNLGMIAVGNRLIKRAYSQSNCL